MSFRILSGAGLCVAALLAGEALAGTTGRCGGTGGNRTATLECPAGQYIVGVGARGAAFVDSMMVRCSGYESDGKRKTPGGWKTGGATGGTQSRDSTCSGNGAVVGFRTGSGIYLDHVHEGACYDRKAGGGFKNESGGTNNVVRVNIGGPGGGYCKIDCPSGEALYKLTVKYGGWVESVRGACRR